MDVDHGRLDRGVPHEGEDDVRVADALREARAEGVARHVEGQPLLDARQARQRLERPVHGRVGAPGEAGRVAARDEVAGQDGQRPPAEELAQRQHHLPVHLAHADAQRPPRVDHARAHPQRVAEAQPAVAAEQEQVARLEEPAPRRGQAQRLQPRHLLPGQGRARAAPPREARGEVGVAPRLEQALRDGLPDHAARPLVVPRPGARRAAPVARGQEGVEPGRPAGGEVLPRQARHEAPDRVDRALEPGGVGLGPRQAPRPPGLREEIEGGRPARCYLPAHGDLKLLRAPPGAARPQPAGRGAVAIAPAGARRDPGGIQTHDLQNRNLTFYSAELRGRNSRAKVNIFLIPTYILPTNLPFLTFAIILRFPTLFACRLNCTLRIAHQLLLDLSSRNP